MAQNISVDVENLWKRVGLEELRQSTAKAMELIQVFEQVLLRLPKCDQCAQAALIDQIKKTGNELNGEIVSLTVLAETLRSVIAVAEKTQRKLIKSGPHPCRCPEEECKCHGF